MFLVMALSPTETGECLGIGSIAAIYKKQPRAGSRRKVKGRRRVPYKYCNVLKELQDWGRVPVRWLL